MAQQCVSATDQYFMFPALNIGIPPLTLSMWINVSSIVVGKHATLFAWRGTVNTEFFLYSIGSNWQLRYSIAGGSQWSIATGLNVSVGAWQHACVAISSTETRLYLSGAIYVSSVSNASTSVDSTGYLAKDPIGDGNHVSFNGAIADAAVWSATLSDAECLALSKRFSPLVLTSRLPSLVLYRDLIRDPGRGLGPALTPVNGPAVVPHPPMRHPQSRGRVAFAPAHFVVPYSAPTAAVHTGAVLAGDAGLAGAAQGMSGPLGEVSS